MIRLRANGKLLLTGEYCILDGALALAIPTIYGQQLEVTPTNSLTETSWESEDVNGNCWFSARWLAMDHRFQRLEASDPDTAERLEHLLSAALELGADFELLRSRRFRTKLDFPREWGLGTSSTLVYLVAEYLKVDAYFLLDRAFGGSGYDVACAGARQPILFQRRQFVEIPWEPLFRSAIYFVYQGRKQDSREGIRRYREQTVAEVDIDHISALTMALVRTDDLDEATDILREHEQHVGRMLAATPIQDRYFSDFPGAVKSLGAWGGDFAVALSPWPEQETRRYFNEKGYSLVMTYDKMLFRSSDY